MSLLTDAQITESKPTLVHPVLTDNQAELVHQALIAFLNSPEGQLASDPAEEVQIKQQLSELVFFFDAVVAHPENFGLRSVEDTKRIARAHKSNIKGPAQPKSQRGKRKLRQATRMGTAKRRRAGRKWEAQQYNEALARLEAKQAEAADRQKRETQSQVDRFETLAKKDTLTNEQVQEIVEMFGSPEGAARMRELRAGDSFADRILGREQDGQDMYDPEQADALRAEKVEAQGKKGVILP